MIDCDVYFTVERIKNGSAVLIPVLISDDGNTRLVANKHMMDTEQAMAFRSGYALAATVDETGGIEAVKEQVDTLSEEDEKEGGPV